MQDMQQHPEKWTRATMIAHFDDAVSLLETCHIGEVVQKKAGKHAVIEYKGDVRVGQQVFIEPRD